MRRSADGVQPAQVVEDIGHSADGRARVLTDRLLLDRDHRREPIDEIDIGLLELGDILARVGRERLEEAPLALGIDRLERQRRLARAAQPGQDHQLLARDLDVDILEVILAGALDADRVSHCRSSFLRSLLLRMIRSQAGAKRILCKT